MKLHLIPKALVAVIATASVLAAGPDTDRVTHLLNRIAFGPALGDVERVRTLGLDRYIDQQLHPETLADVAVERRLERFETLTLSSRELATRYEQPLLAARKVQKNGEDERSPEQRMLAQTANSVMLELSSQKLLRAVYSERQLQEVLTDFWFNHFNVDARKGPDRFLVTAYERDVIRPRVFGSFRDLLGATAKSPAMLFYLDNWMSTADSARPAQSPTGKGARRGLNENYARELMELHTLGVDGGYTQKDVTEVARAFSGWTIDRPRDGGDFRFAPRLHDDGDKIILGHSIPAGGGESDGERVLDQLAEHPSTARFIATKLARRFVSDTPPKGLVDRAAARFRQTHGDLREVVRTILVSKEFQSSQAFGAKAKTPFEFLASALRTAGTDVRDARPYVRAMQELGMPLYQCQPPTGYADSADAWINAGALVARMNVATRVAAGDRQLAVQLGSPAFQRR
jgi:uncharacterized protein (DUF1800 family)